MTDPDLTERVAARYPTPKPWAMMHPDERAYFRGVVSTVIELLDADRERPWPREPYPHVGDAGLEHMRQAMTEMEQ